MFQIDEIPQFYIEDYKTLHHDIGLIKRSNGLWDLWFGQDEISKEYKDNAYLDIVEGDLVNATELHSLQVGIIISCLTSWNYLNRTGNPIYTDFGNKSYSLLKKNKGVNTQYKIKHYFIECLERMRRVYSVEYLNVVEIKNNPYIYKVIFKVLSVTNTIVDGEFYLNTSSSKSISQIDINYNHPYTSVSNPLFMECILKDEYGSFITDEVLYVYVKNDNDSKFKFYGITEPTDDNGATYITIPPKGLNVRTQIMIVFKGNTIYNPCQSKIISIQTVEYFIKSKYTYKEDGYTKDKHILYVENSKGDSIGDIDYKFMLSELLSDYVDLNSIQLQSSIPLDIIQNNNNGKMLEYDSNEKYKLYLIPTNKKIEGTNKVYYNAYAWSSTGDSLKLYPNSDNPVKVQLNTNNPNEVHFLISDKDNGLFEISFDDGHLYYHIDLMDEEI